MNRAILSILSVAVVSCSTATLFAQQPAATTPATAATQAAPVNQTAPQVLVIGQTNSAYETRDQLQDILRQYSPSVGEVLRRDTSLLSRADYMAPYQQLNLFLQQHPEIMRNPAFYFGGFDYYEDRRNPPSRSVEALGVLLGGMAGFLGAATFLGVLVWLVRAMIQHRRWIRLSQVQAEVHTKLMDRMSSNEELMAYIQSPAGRRFLESTPIQAEADAPRLGAPVGPIIWSMMAGVVLATVGLGFTVASRSVTDEAHQAFVVVGMVILALGGGFIVASIMAYLVSTKLGLFPQRKPVENPNNA